MLFLNSSFFKSLTTLRETPCKLTEADLQSAYDLERVEFEEPQDSFLSKVKAIANIIRGAKHCVVYSGAGISTSGGIPDFRGPTV